jgi:ribonuclease E
MADIDDLINFSMNQQPTKFASAFDEIMGQKATAAIDDMKITVAQSMFGAEEDAVEDDDDFDLDDDDDLDLDDNDDLDLSDDDLDDIDLDDEDFDLDDEDLEGFEDDGEDA